MNNVLITFLLFALTHSNSIFDTNLKQQVGSACSSDNKFIISSFDVSDWPALGQSSLITYMGIAQEPITIGIITYSIEDQTQAWYNEYQAIDQNYTQNESATFNNIMQWPMFSGGYLFQMQIRDQINPQYVHACWAFTFVL
ncbi:hypothetical protein SteCoe_26110 [Stentor coeruleus]|uniref:Uncharacterized protein n=1 Tax=Stentor coeruleus TaxID=5963 RepID=A0A1R2BDM2_9CILI|nr:hypothetical protein SteCoe_26110 [Stentor coeruleus]